MNPVVSLIIPSYLRLGRTIQCIVSCLQACDDKDTVEFIIRLQHGDDAALAAIPMLLKKAPVVRIVVGLRYNGYADHHLFFYDAMRIADGTWCWLLSDDSTVHRGRCGKGFDTILKEIHPNQLVIPGHHRLGDSIYEDDPMCPGFILPTGSWLKYPKAIQSPIDLALFAALRPNYPNRFIDFVYHHHRDDGPTIEEYRKK
jgi:hypothetical protein